MLKKSFTVLLLMASIALIGQQGLHLGVQFTPKMPLIINQNTYGDPEYEYAATFGYAGGVELGYHFIEKLGLFTGIQYNRQGQNYEDLSDQQEVITRDVHLDYLRVPLYLRFSSGGDGVGFYANAGMYFGFLRSADIEYYIGTEDHSLADATDRFNDSDMGVLAGLGAQFNFTDQFYGTAGIRFTYGFGDINDEDWHTPNANGVYEESHNASIGLNLGLAYVFEMR